MNIKNRKLRKLKFCLLPSAFSLQRGYTFIELLVVISILGLITTLSIASFVGYNDSQLLLANAANVKDFYTLARSRALSQIKPSVCGTDALNGYQVVLKQMSTYELDVVCGNTAYAIDTKNLSQNITFDPQSTSQVLFNITTASVNSVAKIYISRSGTTKTIQIDTTGNITMN